MSVVVFRPVHGPLRLAMHYDLGNRVWLREVCGARSHVEWAPPLWHVAASHLSAVVPALLDRFGELVLIRDQVTGSGRCDTRCTGAVLDECVCACGGADHRRQWLEGFIPVGETTLVSVGDVTRTTDFLRAPASAGWRWQVSGDDLPEGLRQAREAIEAASAAAIKALNEALKAGKGGGR